VPTTPTVTFLQIALDLSWVSLVGCAGPDEKVRSTSSGRNDDLVRSTALLVGRLTCPSRTAGVPLMW
jgi:hypothetical protein